MKPNFALKAPFCSKKTTRSSQSELRFDSTNFLNQPIMRPFSLLLAIGLLAIALALFYFGFAQENENYALIGVPFMIGAAIVYAVSPQLDWWFYTKNPPALDGQMVALLEQNFDFYTQLELTEKKRFRDRVALFMLATEFTSQGPAEYVPYDVQGAIAAEAVRLTFGMNEFLMPPYEKIAVYPHAFPSPVEHAHHPSETFHEDALIIISAPHQMHAFTTPKQFFNVSLHEFAGVIIKNNNIHFPGIDDRIWPLLERVSGFPNDQLQALMVFPLSQSHHQIAINYFLTFPTKFKELMPDLYQVISNTLNINPLEARQPRMELIKLADSKGKH
jgi:Mlc titration factor MtfA (ptsG expression regulator)